jgi:Notch-like protein
MTNSYGYDEIPVNILKNCIHYFVSPLTHVINRSLVTGIFPDHLKFAETKPIYKKDDKNIISNYRPMTLLTSVTVPSRLYVVAPLCRLPLPSLHCRNST